jgi:Ser/Thr protein kinase RdoA (MazF antagonist)
MAPDLSAPLAHGRTADVYAWDESAVLKLFHDWFSLENIEYELKIARAVHISGVKSPAVRELIQVNGHNGLVYERVNGESMLKMFPRKLWKIPSYARTFAALHAQMHDCVFGADMPSQRERLKRKIEQANALPTPLKTALTTSLLSLPESDRVCHGDFHPDNILLTETDSTIIDWIDATSGNPLADVARTSIILLGARAQTQNLFFKFVLYVFHSIYLREYFRLRPHGRDEYHRWLPIVAGARLSENIKELESWLVRQASRV